MGTLIFLKGDERFVMPCHLGDADHREIVSRGIKDLVEKAQPDVVIFMAEAWIAKFDIDLIRQGRLVRDSRQRQEVVSVQIEFKTGEKFARCAEIKRIKNHVILGRFTNLGINETVGRFMDFYPPSVKH